jgi:hypothetical protein
MKRITLTYLILAVAATLLCGNCYAEPIPHEDKPADVMKVWSALIGGTHTTIPSRKSVAQATFIGKVQGAYIETKNDIEGTFYGVYNSGPKNTTYDKNPLFNINPNIISGGPFIIDEKLVIGENGTLTITGGTLIINSGFTANLGIDYDTTYNNAIINYNGSSIDITNTTQLDVWPASSAVIEKVTGVNSSIIYGTISASGSVFGVFTGTAEISITQTGVLDTADLTPKQIPANKDAENIEPRRATEKLLALKRHQQTRDKFLRPILERNGSGTAEVEQE